MNNEKHSKERIEELLEVIKLLQPILMTNNYYVEDNLKIGTGIIPDMFLTITKGENANTTGLYESIAYLDCFIAKLII